MNEEIQNSYATNWVLVGVGFVVIGFATGLLPRILQLIWVSVLPAFYTYVIFQINKELEWSRREHRVTKDDRNYWKDIAEAQVISSPKKRKCKPKSNASLPKKSKSSPILLLNNDKNPPKRWTAKPTDEDGDGYDFNYIIGKIKK